MSEAATTPRMMMLPKGSNWLPDYMALHFRICKARKRRGVEVVEAAKWVAVTEDEYTEFEAGRRELPAPMIFKLANAFGIRVLIVEGEANDGTD